MKSLDENNLVPKDAIQNIEVSSDTFWVSAQELVNSAHVDLW